LVQEKVGHDELPKVRPDRFQLWIDVEEYKPRKVRFFVYQISKATISVFRYKFEIIKIWIIQRNIMSISHLIYNENSIFTIDFI